MCEEIFSWLLFDYPLKFFCSSEMIPFWLKLLRENNKKSGFGLTLPFLVGALRTPVGAVVVDKHKNISDVKGLLLSMRDKTPGTSYISLTVCDRLHQPVFAESSSHFTPSDFFARIPTLDGKRCFLYVAPNILVREKNQSVGDLLEALWKQNGDAISHGEFSYSKGAFTKYSDKDLLLIARAGSQANEEEI